MADRSHFPAQLGQEVNPPPARQLRLSHSMRLAPGICDNRRVRHAWCLLPFFLAWLLLLMPAAVARAGDPPPSSADTGLSTALDAARQSSGVPGAVACLARPGAKPLFAASGIANLATSRAVRPDDYFAIGSITKMFVAVVVLQLAQEGKLSLDDPLAQYVPDFPRAQAITLRLLLQHKSGIGDPTRALFTAGTGSPGSQALLGAWIVLALQQQWTPERLTQLIACTKPDFAPGEKCEYANANYILLGRVIQLVTGHQVSQEIRTRILAPLGLAHTVFAGEEPLPATDMQCYDLVHGEYADCLALENASFAWCAGAMVSTAADLLRFTQALFHGELLQPEWMQQMLQFTPIEDWGGYGLGVTQHGSGADEAWGHTGRTAGFSSCLWYYPADGSIVVVLANLQRCPLSPIVSAVRQSR